MAQIKPLRILTQPKFPDGCTWYRTLMFVREVREQGLATINMLPDAGKASEDDIFKLVMETDVLYTRFTSTAVADMIWSVKTKMKKLNKKIKIVLDTDDDLFNISPLNNAYEAWGPDDVVLPDGRELWINGKGKFDKFTNRRSLISYEEALETADVVTTTTMRLKEQLDKHNDNVVVFPNSLKARDWPELPKQNDGKVRVLWAGGSSHYEDLIEIQEPLKAIMEKYPHVELHVVGHHFPGFTRVLPQEQVKTWDWINCDGHSWRLAGIRPDIGLAPLQDRAFNRAKSCLKWYEYSMLGIPTIAGNVPPYSDEIIHGVNGILANPDTFYQELEKLILDPKLRVALGANAKSWVQENRNIEQTTKEWVEFMYALAGKPMPEGGK
jgi:hypothetical protein